MKMIANHFYNLRKYAIPSLSLSLSLVALPHSKAKNLKYVVIF